MWWANREVDRMRWEEESACHKTKGLYLACHMLQMKNQD